MLVLAKILLWMMYPRCIDASTRIGAHLESIFHGRIPPSSFLSPVNDIASSGKNIEMAWLKVSTDHQKEQSWDFQASIGFKRDKVLALHRWKIWWMIPTILHGKWNEGKIPPETYLVLGELEVI